MAKLKDRLKAKKAELEQIAIPANELRLPLDKILLRESDTRPLNQGHIEALAQSIAVVGLIQPITVDIKGRLLAGGHRRAAIEYLKTNNIKAFDKWFSDGIPVHCFDFNADTDAELALAIETSENEKRRDYTPSEVRELADRLVAAGYHHGKGQPKKGTNAVGPTLEIITGKSRRTIERYLSKSDKSNPTDDGLLRDMISTKRSLTKLLKRDDCPDNVRKAALQFMKLLNQDLRK